MKLILISFLFLSACQTMDFVFFGETEKSLYIDKKTESLSETHEKKILESNLKKDYYGFPILEIIQNKSKTEIENSVYYAVKNSFARTKKHHYRIVGWEKSRGKTKSLAKEIKNNLIELGVPEKNIYTHYHIVSKSQKFSKVRLYER